ncbi:MAG TPA: IS21 family transposase [Acholeplasmataceae bacterium]|nr:IS21 family transposase [Acholeplasmataceae bacterium]
MRIDVMYTVRRLVNKMTINTEKDFKINVSKLARENSCDWRTAKKYIEGYDPKEKKQRPSKLDYFKEFITKKYSEGCTAKSIYLYLIKRGYNGKLYEGKYTILREFCRDIKIKEAKKAVVRYETLPGEQAQVDWKESFKLYTKYGEQLHINVFLYTLKYSRKKYLTLTLDRKQNTFFNSLINAFKSTNGVPDTILFDNMKTVVDRARSEFQKVVLNEKFRQLSLDIGFNPVICRAYRPKSKGSVETVAKLIDRLKVYNNEFETIDDLSDIIKEFNEDIKRKVNRESMIEYKGSKYSVPPHLIGQMVEIRVEGTQLFIYYNNLFIHSHQLSKQKFNYSKEHLIEILQNDAFRQHNTEDIERIAEENLEKLDKLYSLGEVK